MQKNLFGEKSKYSRKTKLERSLLKYDIDSFTDRLQRLKYIFKIIPKGFGFAADTATVYIFEEAKMAFINGEFISTVLLSQAFIERRLQMYYNSLGFEKIAAKGLNSILKHAKANNTIHHFLLDKIDLLRKKRNPLVHLKEFDYEYDLAKRMIESARISQYKVPLEILYDDAKDAISLMYAIFITRLK